MQIQTVESGFIEFNYIGFSLLMTLTVVKSSKLCMKSGYYFSVRVVYYSVVINLLKFRLKLR